MSYILEALRKSERERELGRVPRFTATEEAGSKTRWHIGVWVVGFALVLNGLLLAAAVLIQSRAHFTGGGAEELSTRIELPIPHGTQEKRAQQSTIRSLAAEAHISRQAPDAQVAKLTDDLGADTAAPASASPVPLLEEMPLPVQQSISRFKLDVHVYSEAPEDRFVLFNLKKYHEGDQIEDGPLLEQISPEGVVLNHQGQRFRLQRQ
jgi:hypothetical protein